MLSRAARSRTATELKQQEEEKELAQKELSDHKEPIPEKASEDEDETPLTLKADSQQQRVYDVSRKIQQLLLANQITESITQYAELKQLTVPNEVRSKRGRFLLEAFNCSAGNGSSDDCGAL